MIKKLSFIYKNDKYKAKFWILSIGWPIISILTNLELRLDHELAWLYFMTSFFLYNEQNLSYVRRFFISMQHETGESIAHKALYLEDPPRLN